MSSETDEHSYGTDRIEGTTYSWSLSGSLRKRRSLALFRRLALGDRVFAQWAYVEVGVLAPADPTVVTEDLGGQALGCLPPRLGLSSAASSAVVVLRRELCDNRALVVVWSFYNGSLLCKDPARRTGCLNPLVFLA